MRSSGYPGLHRKKYNTHPTGKVADGHPRRRPGESVASRWTRAAPGSRISSRIKSQEKVQHPSNRDIESQKKRVTRFLRRSRIRGQATQEKSRTPTPTPTLLFSGTKSPQAPQKKCSATRRQKFSGQQGRAIQDSPKKFQRNQKPKKHPHYFTLGFTPTF